MTFGLTDEGFFPATQEDEENEIKDRYRSEFGQSLPLTPDTPDGQAISIIAERLALLWELGEAIYKSHDPDSNTGQAQDAICSITGTIRKAATPSSAVLTLTGNDATLVAAGSQSSTNSTSKKFATLIAITLNEVTAWASATAYAIGDRVANSGNVYECVVAGTSAGSGGPSGETTGITDNTVTWDFVGNGTAANDVEAEATETGPTVAVARDVTVIETPVAGWSSVINLEDATPGTDLETDEELRVRREEELATPGTGPVEAIRADLLKVPGVTSAYVFNNPLDTTNADGMPPHSIEALVQGGDDQAIREQLHKSVDGGCRTHGTTTGTVTDSEGTVHTYKFTRPTEIEIYVDVELDYEALDYPSNGDDQVKAAIVAGAYVGIPGRDVRASALSAEAHEVMGVLGITLLEIGTSPSPSSSGTIVISSRQLAVYDTSRITVVSSAATP